MRIIGPKLKLGLGVSAVLALAGCAASSDVQTLSDGSYRITSGALLASVDQPAAALARARLYCGKSGQVPVATTDSAQGSAALGVAAITFTCRPL